MFNGIILIVCLLTADEKSITRSYHKFIDELQKIENKFHLSLTNFCYFIQRRWNMILICKQIMSY